MRKDRWHKTTYKEGVANLPRILEDITGKKFNKLTAIKLTDKPKKRGEIWLWQCECGNLKEICRTDVVSLNTKSCGCLLRPRHGKCSSKTYKAWRAMRWRCGHDPYYLNITYSKEWEYFENFYRDMGEKPSENHSLDRIDVNGNYSKENCRWATHAEQMWNQGKRKNTRFKYKGVAYTSNEKNKYRSSILVNYKRIHLGVFSTQEEAALAYNEAAKKYFGEFAVLNVIENN